MISNNYSAVKHLAAVKDAAAAYRDAYRDHLWAGCTAESAADLKDAEFKLNNAIEDACGGR